MPSESKRQHNTMEAAAHDDEFAEQLGIPQSVAREYVNADKHDDKWKEREKVKKAEELGMDFNLYDELFGNCG